MVIGPCKAHVPAKDINLKLALLLIKRSYISM